MSLCCWPAAWVLPFAQPAGRQKAEPLPASGHHPSLTRSSPHHLALLSPLHIPIRYWLSVGAQPSQTVARLLGQAGVIPKPPPGLSKGVVKNPDKYAKK